MHNAQVKTVYRAPGGALPPSFWYQQPEGVQGGLELAFMSTTTAKEEAMAYARRAPGMILFEIQQGFVARGASIAWLSQVPTSLPASLPARLHLSACLYLPPCLHRHRLALAGAGRTPCAAAAAGGAGGGRRRRAVVACHPRTPAQDPPSVARLLWLFTRLRWLSTPCSLAVPE